MTKVFKISKKTSPRNAKPKFLEGLKVRNGKGESVVISDFWKTQTVVLKVLRRFGCPLCRYEARLLSELKPEFDALGIKLVALGFEDVGLEEFVAGGFWEWEILVDSERSVHLALDIPKLSVSNGLKDLVSSSTRVAIVAAIRAGTYGDLQGDSLQLGGTFVVEKRTSKILYEFRQAGAGSFTSLKDILKCCGGDPCKIEEKAPEECLTGTNQSHWFK